MPDQEKHELEVGFEIQGVDDKNNEVQVRPGLHLPNVVSRRGHRVKIIVSVFDVPDPTMKTIVRLQNATVNVFSDAVVGNKGDLARPSQLWGSNVADVSEVEVNPGDLDPGKPAPTIYIVVQPKGGDDHLGQGPDYEATVDVSSQTIFLLTDKGGATTSGRDASSGTQRFNIPFSSR